MSSSSSPARARMQDFVALPDDSDSDASDSDREDAAAAVRDPKENDDDDEDGFGSDWTDEFTDPVRLAGLLEQAKLNAEKAWRASKSKSKSNKTRSSDSDGDEDNDNADPDARDEELDILLLENDDAKRRDPKMPKLDASSSLPALYIEWDKNDKSGAPTSVRNLDAEQMLASTASRRSAGPKTTPGASGSKPRAAVAPPSAADDDTDGDDEYEDNDEPAMALDVALPAPAQPAFELDAKGKRVTKKDQRERKTATAGSNWYDLPAPPAAELPKLYREVEAMRLRNQLDPKRFYRKDESEGRGIKGLPKYFAIGTVVTTPSPFGGAAPGGDNLPRAARKRTIVDELVDDAETRRYAKRKFSEFQGTREAKGRRTLKDKQAKRTRKW